MRHRDPGQRGGGDRRSDARHDLERDAGRVERQGFFATAPEHERVARLQPHHAAATARGANQEPIDRLLAHRGPAGSLADIETLRARCQRQHVLRDERVVQHEFCTLEPVVGGTREQLRIARARADERDEAAAHSHTSCA